MQSVIPFDQLQQLLSNQENTVSPVSTASADKFKALMQHGHVVAPTDAGADSTSIVSRMIGAQDHAMQQVPLDMAYLMQNQDTMSTQQFVASAIQVSMEATMMQVDMQSKMAVVKSSKDSIETLMKNQ